jgi:hypothetical protein
MSELLYKRSLQGGDALDADAVKRELEANGTSGYDNNTSYYEAPPLDLKALGEYWVLDSLSDLEIEFMLAEEHMTSVAELHPIDSWRIGQVLKERLDELQHQGHPVDAEMYVEADDLAVAFVESHPDKDIEEIIEIAQAMIDMNRAHYQMQRFELLAA